MIGTEDVCYREECSVSYTSMELGNTIYMCDDENNFYIRVTKVQETSLQIYVHKQLKASSTTVFLFKTAITVLCLSRESIGSSLSNFARQG